MSDLATIGFYRRNLTADIVRLFENALDWEHLPHLHDSSFEAITPIASDPSGWTADARFVGGMKVSLDLRLDRVDGIWITRTRSGSTVVSEIISRASARGPGQCHVEVEFRMADVPAERREAMADYYRALYARLYDEDEAMMIARTDALAAGAAGLRERRSVTLADGSKTEIPLRCPHWGLPLDAEPDADGIITCPWHGYRFDARTGACVSGQTCNWQEG